MTTSTEPVSVPSGASGVSPEVAEATVSPGDASMSTTINSLQDLKKKAPTVYNAMMQGIAQNIVSQMQTDSDNLVAMMQQEDDGD